MMTKSFLQRALMAAGLLLLGVGCGEEGTASTPCPTDMCDGTMDMGGADSTRPPGIGASCDGSLDCDEALSCVRVAASSSICLESCTTPGESCGTGRGECVATSTEGAQAVCFVGRAVLGMQCTSNIECGDSLVCLQTVEGAQGACAAACDEPLGLCGGGEVCLPTSSTGGSGAPAGLCYTGGSVQEGGACATSIDCSKGLRCLSSGDESFCVRACEDDSSCREGARCLSPSGAPDQGATCRPDTGASCASDADCSAEASCSVGFEDPFFFSNLWPGGACSLEPCEPGGCLLGSTCRDVATGDATLAVCAPTCASDADCRVSQGWRCLDASSCGDMASGCKAYFGAESLCQRPDRLYVLQ